jgi:hypothetical protein
MHIIRNETIRTRMRMMKDILQETEGEQLRWRGLVMQMEDCRVARRVAEWNSQGQRKRGRAVNTWKDGIRDGMQRRHLKDEEYFDGGSGGKNLCLWVEENCIQRKRLLFPEM